MNAQELAVVEEMGMRWLRVESALDANISALANEMLRRQAEGEVVTEAMIRQSNRYKILKEQAAQEVSKYNKDAKKIIAAGQENALQMGINTAQDAITVSIPRAGSSAFNRINIKAVNAMVGYAGDGSPLSKLLKNDLGDAADGVLQALVNGVARGQGADAVAREMIKGLDMGLDRSLLIARTELNRSYRTGSVEQYGESGVTVGFMRLVARDEACAACLALDGEMFDTADEMDDHPNGRCTCVPVINGEPPPEWEKAQDWFANQDEARQSEVLGNTRFEMYQNGTPLDAFATKAHSNEWGDSPALVPISNLQK
jgi:SPP1 gp7 family putative phage head morphogenesis protein